jgi:hypothetical protein
MHAAAEPRLGRGHAAYRNPLEINNFVGPVPSPGVFFELFNWLLSAEEVDGSTVMKSAMLIPRVAGMPPSTSRKDA